MDTESADDSDPQAGVDRHGDKVRQILAGRGVHPLLRVIVAEMWGQVT
jgi:hypothetical protein